MIASRKKKAVLCDGIGDLIPLDTCMARDPEELDLTAMVKRGKEAAHFINNWMNNIMYSGESFQR